MNAPRCPEAAAGRAGGTLLRIVAGSPGTSLDEPGEAQGDRLATTALAGEAILVLGSAWEHPGHAHDLLVQPSRRASSRAVRLVHRRQRKVCGLAVADPESTMLTHSLDDPPGQPLRGRPHCLSALLEDRLERPVGASGEHQRANLADAGVEELSVTKRDERRHGLVVERRERIIRNRQTLKPHAASSRLLRDGPVESVVREPAPFTHRPIGGSPPDLTRMSWQQRPSARPAEAVSMTAVCLVGFAATVR